MTAGLASHILDTVSQHKFGSDQNISEKEKILLGLFFIALSLRYVKHSTLMYARWIQKYPLTTLFQLVDNKVAPAAETEQGRVRVHPDPVRVLAAVCGYQQAGADGALHHPHGAHHQPPAQHAGGHPGRASNDGSFSRRRLPT